MNQKSYNDFNHLILVQLYHSLITDMIKKIVKKLQKRKNNYSSPTNYDINHQGFKVVNDNVEKNSARGIARNQVKQLSNDFYSQLYSFKNLPIQYFLLITVVAPIVSIASVYLMFIATQKDSSLVPSITLAILSLVIFIGCRDKNEKLIVQKYSTIHGKDFRTIDEVRFYWIIDRVGLQTDIYEFAKKLSEWKMLKEEYNRNSKINWFNYIYDPQSKPRILALFIALVSLFTIITINAFEIEPLSVLITVFGFKHILIEETWLVLLLIFFICLISWQIIFIGHILGRGVTYLIDSINSDNISEVKFSILINFLLDHSDFASKK